MDYNPFQPSGRYNIKVYIYEHKTETIGLLMVVLLLCVLGGVVVWS